jgi:hypothetical protein
MAPQRRPSHRIRKGPQDATIRDAFADHKAI